MTSAQAARRWTYADLLALPDDGKRREIIDGVCYETPSPNTDHATIIINLLALCLPLVRGLGGRLITAPLDLFLPNADPVQPDILALLTEQVGLVSKRGVEGAPALIVEVLSPSNPEHDRVTKRALYARAGVREYWLVSPEAAIVDVLTLGGDRYETHVRAANDEEVTSTVLPALRFPASVAFS